MRIRPNESQSRAQASRTGPAAKNLEEILTNRNRLSEDILSDVTESANGYGVAIRRADVKDLIFPGNLQEIMNRVLAAEVLEGHPALLRLAELETLRDLAKNANARLYLDLERGRVSHDE